MSKPNRRIQTVRPDHFDQIRANTHILYRCFNKKDALLYVGMTSDPEHRFKSHRETKIWWKYVDHITLQPYPNRRQLEYAETSAIRMETPKFNVINTYVPTVRHLGGRKALTLWSEPSRFGNVQHDDDEIDNDCIERHPFPCPNCLARRTLYLEPSPDKVVCELCSSEWPYEEWFALNFPGHKAAGAGA